MKNEDPPVADPSEKKWKQQNTPRKTIELLNARLEGTFEPEFAKPVADVVKDCMACHSSAETSGGYPVQGSEDCSACHTDYTEDHP